MPFEDAIAEHGGGDLGWLSQGDLPSDLEDALMALEPNGVAEPVRGPSGVHIFRLHERETGGSSIRPFAELRQDLYRQLLDSAMQQQETIFMRELRDEAIIDRRIGSQ